jgi:hypothetical protein
MAPATAVEKNRELTTRDQNLFGEKYPAATLQALGLTKPAAAAPPKKATKKGRHK